MGSSAPLLKDPFSAAHQDSLKDFFKECGEISKVRWLTHMDSGEFKGCGYVEFWEGGAAEAAVKFNGKPLKGRPIRLDWDAGGRNHGS